MFKTKGFSSNNSLKRRAVIVDAPDLPPEECEFFITPAGIADTDKIEMPTVQAPVLDFEVETLYEESSDQEDSEGTPLIDVKGIGKGTAENLNSLGIRNIEDLIAANPEDIAMKISGLSLKKVEEMQKSAKGLVNI